MSARPYLLWTRFEQENENDADAWRWSASIGDQSSLLSDLCEWRDPVARFAPRWWSGWVTEPRDFAGPRIPPTARQWQRVHGQTAVGWMRSSGVAQRMLDDVCVAVQTTVDWVVGDDPERARQVINQYPSVLSRCDDLSFEDIFQALAYLILHLPDRYCRMFQVLERLLVDGRLPVGRGDHFAAIDIGAGPGPGIFAMRNFYAALACYTKLHDPSWQVSTTVGCGRAGVGWLCWCTRDPAFGSFRAQTRGRRSAGSSGSLARCRTTPRRRLPLRSQLRPRSPVAA